MVRIGGGAVKQLLISPPPEVKNNGSGGAACSRCRDRMPIMRCKVSFTDSAGTEQAVEVEAESLYDADGVAIARFHDAPREMSELLKIRGYPSRNIEFDIAARLATLVYCAIKNACGYPFSLFEA
jgi:hypothetical protein